MLSKTDNPGDAERPEITALLNRAQQGDRDAEERAAALVYDELHKIASRAMRHERHDHMLQTTALVSEAYLRLSQSKPLELKDRAHFFALASQQMRRILVDHARARKAERRGGGELALDIHDIQVSATHKGVDVLRLDDALTALERVDPRAAKVI